MSICGTMFTEPSARMALMQFVFDVWLAVASNVGSISSWAGVIAGAARLDGTQPLDEGRHTVAAIPVGVLMVAEGFVRAQRDDRMARVGGEEGVRVRVAPELAVRDVLPHVRRVMLLDTPEGVMKRADVLPECTLRGLR